MRTNLTVDDLGDLLSQPLVATLATYRKSGDVLLSPVWFEWVDGGFNFVVGRNDVKAQHMRRDPRASMAVYENGDPLRGLEMRGTPRLFTEGLHELRQRIYHHYMGEGPKTPDESEIGVRLEGTIRAWDFAD
ncbi:MAG TPA: pyridoxamine 5'-phosphate oxidase family protein [Candidatus Dormibacteraeota bacterium]